MENLGESNDFTYISFVCINKKNELSQFFFLYFPTLVHSKKWMRLIKKKGKEKMDKKPKQWKGNTYYV